MQPEKCETCEYWARHGETLDAPGNCQRYPPNVTFVQVEVPPERGIALPKNAKPQPLIQTNMQPYFPITTRLQFCGEHPAAVRRRANEVKYSPSEFGDGNAGFNKAPSLREVMKYAVGVESMKNRFEELRVILRGPIDPLMKPGYEVERDALESAIVLIDPEWVHKLA